MAKLITIVLTLLFGAFLVLVISLLFAIVTKWAWAGSVAQIFHLPELTFMQAFWLNMLGGMVFKSASTSSSKD